MTVLLLLATFAVFLTIDYIRDRKRIAQLTTQPVPEVVAVPKLRPNFVSGFDLRENLQYHPGHTWALQESPTLVRVGLDDFAARLAGKIDSIILPKPGVWIRQGQKFLTVLKDGNKVELVSPIEGEVTGVNEAAMKDTTLPSRDPYGQGWLMTVLSPDAQTSFRNLLSGNLARQWMAEAASRLRAKIPAMAMAGAFAQDGGIAVDDLAAFLPGQTWIELAHEFFLI
jgi:glycine cleavage system H protein